MKGRRGRLSLSRYPYLNPVMPGLDPGIHANHGTGVADPDMDARVECGHDGKGDHCKGATDGPEEIHRRGRGGTRRHCAPLRAPRPLRLNFSEAGRIPNLMTPQLRATLIGGTAVLMWGALALLTTWTGRVPPFQLLALAFGIAFPLSIAKWLLRGERPRAYLDRKSTRLNSSH